MIKKKVIQREGYEVYYHEIMDNIDFYLNIVNNENIKLKDGIEVQMEGPFKYKTYIYFGEYQVHENITPHGRGVLLYKNDDKYYGNFKNGKKKIVKRYG